MKTGNAPALITSAALAPAKRLCVAFSGGPDSTALLHALAQLPEARARGLRALHVDHGLHPQSGQWAAHCAHFCGSMGVPLTTERVDVRDARGEGTEAAARRARYAAFAQALREGEWLALAHHRDDQVETVVLKLLRGAGPEGLGGMRLLRPFGRGSLWRPLLGVPRDSIRSYLAAHGIASLEDPANADPAFARNVVRHELLPLIARHWPRAPESILHAARLARDAAACIASIADAELATLRDAAGTLDAQRWLALPAALRAATLDAWLRARGVPAPPDAARAELERQAANAARDRVPTITWPGAEVRIWLGRLHATPPLAPALSDWQAEWDGVELPLPRDCGALALLPATGDAPAPPIRFSPPLTVHLPRGGERIRPAGDACTRELADLFRRARIPPWLRTRCPLLLAGSEPIAVADLWASERGEALFARAGARPRWTRPAWAPARET